MQRNMRKFRNFSAENIIPVIWWRYGINKYTDIGYRLGIPLSGTGIDFNRILMKKDYSWDVLNVATVEGGIIVRDLIIQIKPNIPIHPTPKDVAMSVTGISLM